MVISLLLDKIVEIHSLVSDQTFISVPQSYIMGSQLLT